jgi:hypothetical protein
VFERKNVSLGMSAAPSGLWRVDRIMAFQAESQMRLCRGTRGALETGSMIGFEMASGGMV